MGAGSPYNISTIDDLAALGSVNLLTGLKGRTLPMDSWVVAFANQEAVTGSWQATVGATEVVIPNTPATLQATVGVMPIQPDDLLFLTLGDKGEEVIVNYTNGDGAVAREGRLKLFVIPISAALALQFAISNGLSVPAAAAILGR